MEHGAVVFLTQDDAENCRCVHLTHSSKQRNPSFRHKIHHHPTLSTLNVAATFLARANHPAAIFLPYFNLIAVDAYRSIHPVQKVHFSSAKIGI